MYYDSDSERCIIAAMLDSEEALIEAVSVMQTGDFYDPKHAAMFDILSGLFAKAVKPSYLEMLKEGSKQKTLATQEDREYAKQTLGFHVSTASLPYWFKNVKEKAKLRRLRLALMRLAEEIKNPAVDVDKLVFDAERMMTDLETDTTEKIEGGAELSQLGKRIIEERMKNKGELHGIPTGIGKLNRLTSGWKPGDLILLTAATGKGKTAFSQNFILRACFLGEIPTLYINSEMSSEQVILRFSSMMSEIENDKIKFGEITEKEKETIFATMNLVESAPFFHYPSPALNIQRVIGVIRKLHVQKGVRFVIVDYVGRMDKFDKELKEWQVLEQICKALKTIAQELKISVMVLAQLNDDQTLQAAKRMENEADIFIKLLPMKPEEIEEAQKRNYKLDPNYWVYLGKNRDGQGEVMIPVLFKKETLSVIDVANH